MQRKQVIETWLKSVNRDGDNIKDVLKPFINDVLDLGMGIMVKGFVKDAYFHVQRTTEDNPVEQTFPTAFEWTYIPSTIKSGMLRELNTHDAGTFFAQPDEFGQKLGWWQWLNQTTPSFFSNREVVDYNYQPLSYNVYGISPVDVVKNLVNVLVTSVANMEQYMEDGAIPPAVGILQGVSDTDFDIFADRWEASVAGNQSSIPLMSTGELGKFDFVELIKNVDQIKQLDTIEAYQKIVMSVFHVTPAELGITDAVNKSSAEQQSQVQKRAAIFPLLDGLENLINKYVLREFDPEGRLKFKWIKPQTIQDQTEEWSLIQQQLQSGFYTINDIKKRKGEPQKAWGDVPYSEAVWAQLAQEFDPELYGFKEQKEDADTAKIEYAQRQVLTLLEQMQYGLQNDKDLTPIALQVLTRLKLLREAIAPAGTLSLPPSSVVETENMIDAMSRTDKWQTTTEIFDKYKNEELVALRQTKKSIEGEIVDKAVGVKGTFNPFKKKHAFYVKALQLLNKKKSDNYQKNMDNMLTPIEEKLTGSISTIYRSWFGKLKKFLFNFDKEDMVKAFPSKFMEEATKAIDNSITMTDFKEIITDNLADAFKIGFRRNNLGKVEDSTKKVSVKKFQPRAYNWLEQNSLYFSDRLATDQAQDIKGIILRGLAEGQSVPKMTKGIKSVLAPDNDEDKKRVAKRAKMIARTEIIRASVQGTIAQMETLGAVGWQHHTHFDERNINEKEYFDKKRNITVPPCREQHGRIYKMSNTRLLPPLHPNCRCTVLSVFAKRKPTIPEKKSLPSNFQWNKLDIVVKSAIKDQKKKTPNLKNKLKEIQALYDGATTSYIKATLAIELLRIAGMWKEDEEVDDFLQKKGIEGLQEIAEKKMPQQPRPAKLKDPKAWAKYKRDHPATVYLPPDQRKSKRGRKRELINIYVDVMEGDITENEFIKQMEKHQNIKFDKNMDKVRFRDRQFEHITEDEFSLVVAILEVDKIFDKDGRVSEKRIDRMGKKFGLVTLAEARRNAGHRHSQQNELNDIMLDLDGYNDEADIRYAELEDLLEKEESEENDEDIAEAQREIESHSDGFRDELSKLINTYNKDMSLVVLSQNSQVRGATIDKLEDLNYGDKEGYNEIVDIEKALEFAKALKREAGSSFSESELQRYNEFLFYATKKRKVTLKDPEAVKKDLRDIYNKLPYQDRVGRGESKSWKFQQIQEKFDNYLLKNVKPHIPNLYTSERIRVNIYKNQVRLNDFVFGTSELNPVLMITDIELPQYVNKFITAEGRGDIRNTLDDEIDIMYWQDMVDNITRTKKNSIEIEAKEETKQLKEFKKYLKRSAKIEEERTNTQSEWKEKLSVYKKVEDGINERIKDLNKKPKAASKMEKAELIAELQKITGNQEFWRGQGKIETVADLRKILTVERKQLKKKTSKAITEADVDVFIPEYISTNSEAGKEHKFAVNYRLNQSPNKCKNCTYFMKGKCKIVAGDIKPEYVCDKWRKA